MAVQPHVVIALENEPYPYDSRVRQEAQALVANGYAVTVCGPTGLGFDALEEEIDGVRVLRYPVPAGGRDVLGYLREYALSLLRLGRLMRRAARTRSVDCVIVCSPPDLTVLPALPLRRRGAGLIFDHHDLSPELFELKFGRRRLIHALVLAAERFALRCADVVIATNETYAEIEVDRGGVDPKRVFVVRNGPDPRRIHEVEPRPELRRGRPHLVCWVGMIGGGEGLDHLLDAAEDIVKRRGRDDIGFAIVGPGDGRSALIAEAQRRGLGSAVDFPGRADDALLRQYLATAAVCVSTYEPNPMNHARAVTKVVEYMAMGRPVVQFGLREATRICGDGAVYARPDRPGDLADRIVELVDDPQRAAAVGAAGRRRATEGLLWPQQVPALLEAVRVSLDARAAPA